jgi:hypothetical protein
MTPPDADPESEASIARVRAWKQRRVGPKPPFSDYRVYYRTMRWGPFSYWTWRGLIILLSGALLVYVVVFTACLSRAGGCRPFMTLNPWGWFLRPVP